MKIRPVTLYNIAYSAYMLNIYLSVDKCYTGLIHENTLNITITITVAYSFPLQDSLRLKSICKGYRLSLPRQWQTCKCIIFRLMRFKGRQKPLRDRSRISLVCQQSNCQWCSLLSNPVSAYPLL